MDFDWSESYSVNGEPGSINVRITGRLTDESPEAIEAMAKTIRVALYKAAETIAGKLEDDLAARPLEAGRES